MGELDTRSTDQLPITPNPTPTAGVVMMPDGTRPFPLGSGHITGLLGEGGMAIVYEIWNDQLGIRRAVKLLRPNSAAENRGKILTEARITAQLDHPNIISIYSVGEWNSLPYIEMERIDGFTLSQIIQQYGALPVEFCTAVGMLVSGALDYTHRHEYAINGKHHVGILHRDLKPGNIMISRRGVVRITDFGIATPAAMAASNTSSGKVVGSMQYLAPEQLEEQEATNRSDIFSFGCTLYEMLTGEKAFPERNISKLIRKRLDNDYIPIRSYKIAIPKRLRLLLECCMHRNPAKRPADMREIQIELSRIWEHMSTRRPEEVIATFIQTGAHEKRIIFPVRRIPKWAIAAGIAVLIAGAATPALIYYHQNSILIRVQFAMFMEDLARKLKGEIPATSTVSATPETTRSSTPPPAAAPAKPVVIAAADEHPVEKAASSAATKDKSVKESSGTTKGTAPSTKDPAATTAAPTTLLDTMESIHATRNIPDLITAEDGLRHYDIVMSLLDLLSPEQLRAKEMRLYRHRALVGTSRVSRSYFDNNNINDGEFYLSKAQYLYNTEQYQPALWILGVIKSSPLALSDRRTIENEVLLYTARCQTSLYEVNPNDQGLETAMRAWFEVKNAFRANQGHPYFAEANRNIRVLSRKD